jgi:hypothetical protein
MPRLIGGMLPSCCRHQAGGQATIPALQIGLFQSRTNVGRCSKRRGSGREMLQLFPARSSPKLVLDSREKIVGLPAMAII